MKPHVFDFIARSEGLLYQVYRSYKEVFWEYARFKHPSHQISFHSIRALECLKYERSIAVENDTVE